MTPNQKLIICNGWFMVHIWLVFAAFVCFINGVAIKDPLDMVTALSIFVALLTIDVLRLMIQMADLQKEIKNVRL